MSKKENEISVSKKKVKVGRSDRVFYTIVYVITIILTLLVLYPIVFVISASFSSSTAVAQGKVWLWPVDFNLASYKSVIN